MFFFKMTSSPSISFFFFFNDTATTEIYTLSLHDALPICVGQRIVLPERAQIPRSTPVFLVLVGIPLVAYSTVLELAYRKHWRTTSAVGVAIFVGSVATTFAVVLASLVAWVLVGDR